MGAVKYKCKRVPDGYVVTAMVPTQKGYVKVKAGAKFSEVRRGVFRQARRSARRGYVSGHGEYYAELGFINFKSVGRAIKGLTKSRAMRKAFKTVRKVAAHPAVGAGLMLVNPALGVGLQATLKAIDQGEGLIKAARSGKPGDRRRVKARALISVAQKASTPKRAAAAAPAGVPPEALHYLSMILPQLRSARA